jgi:hypothetical protein
MKLYAIKRDLASGKWALQLRKGVATFLTKQQAIRTRDMCMRADIYGSVIGIRKSER